MLPQKKLKSESVVHSLVNDTASNPDRNESKDAKKFGRMLASAAGVLATLLVVACIGIIVIAQVMPLLPGVLITGPTGDAVLDKSLLGLICVCVAGIPLYIHGTRNKMEEGFQDLKQKLNGVCARVEDVLLAQNEANQRPPKDTKTSSLPSWKPELFSGGHGLVSTLNCAMKAEITRRTVHDGVWLGLIEASDIPPSFRRLRRANGVSRWTLGVYLDQNERALMNLCATEFAIRCYPKHEAARDRRLDLNKLVIMARMTSSPLHTRVHIPDGSGTRILHYESPDDQFTHPILRRLSGTEFDTACREWQEFQQSAYRISVPALRYYLGSALADERGFVSKAGIANRLRSVSPTMSDLIDITAAGDGTTNCDHFTL